MISLRHTKKLCKKAMQEMGLVKVGTVRRLFVVKPKAGFLCMRWYGYTIAAENHPSLGKLIQEQKEGESK